MSYIADTFSRKSGGPEPEVTLADIARELRLLRDEVARLAGRSTWSPGPPGPIGSPGPCGPPGPSGPIGLDFMRADPTLIELLEFMERSKG